MVEARADRSLRRCTFGKQTRAQNNRSISLPHAPTFKPRGQRLPCLDARCSWAHMLILCALTLPYLSAGSKMKESRGRRACIIHASFAILQFIYDRCREVQIEHEGLRVSVLLSSQEASCTSERGKRRFGGLCRWMDRSNEIV